MTDDHFTQKEMLVAMIRKLDETHDVLIRHIAQEDAQLADITQHVQRTNGRVSKLEDEVDAINVKHEGMAVKISAAVFLATTIVVSIINKYFF